MTGPLPQAEFDAVYSRVPRLTVEVILWDDRGVFLTRRASGPCAGLWHIPGGTARFAEPLEEAAGRIARTELGVTAAGARLAGVIEYPSHYLKGLDCPVGVAFEIEWDGEPRAGEGADLAGWFTGLPEAMHDEQALFLASLDIGEAQASAVAWVHARGLG